jgi:hypothetical protein
MNLENELANFRLAATGREGLQVRILSSARRARVLRRWVNGAMLAAAVLLVAVLPLNLLGRSRESAPPPSEEGAAAGISNRLGDPGLRFCLEAAFAQCRQRNRLQEEP